MIFLIEYESRQGRIATLQSFADSERELAQGARLALELRLNRCGIDREVILLEAVDEASLRRTHSRYFKNLDQIVESFLIGSN